MKKFQRLVLLSLVTSLLISSFEHKLNAQIKSNVNQIAQGQSNPVRSPTPLTSVNPPDKSINQAPSTANDPSNDTDGPSVPDWLAWIGLFATLGCTIPLLSHFLKQKVWRLREDWPDIQHSRQILNESIYQEIDFPKKLIEQKIKQDIILCIEVKDLLKKENISTHLIDIVRIFIEFKILKNEKLTKTELKEKCDNKEKRSPISIEYETCFEIYEQGVYEKAKQYLIACKKLNIRDNDKDISFLCSIKLNNGFLAPLYLVAGPQRYFPNAWPKIIKEYNKTIDNPYVPNGFSDSLKASIKSLQSSIFTTWIGWGPSIPIGSCSEWGGRNDQKQITLQYGFGDESNSIPVLLPYGNKKRYIDEFLGHAKSNENASIIIKQATITATPTLLGKSTRDKLAHAQIELIDTVNYEIILKLFTNKIDDLRQHIISGDEEQAVNYYTSYVWVLLAMIREEEQDQFTKDIKDVIKVNPDEIEQRNITVWRRLLPFFEHVNLADPESYKIQKEALAYKTIKIIKQLYDQQQSYDQQRNLKTNLKFLYFCAFDHCNCKNSSSEQEDGLILSQSQGSIKEILEELNKEEIDRGNDIPIDFSTAGILPAHDLPNLIDKMNKFIELKEQKNKQQ